MNITHSKTYTRLLVLLVCLFFLPNISKAATLTLSPSSSSVSVGATFTVSILLNTSAQNIYGVDINKLHFNSSQLQVVDSDGATAGVQVGAGTLMPVTTTNTVDNTAGTVQFSQLANPGSTYNGSGTLATITFQALSAGTASVTIDFTSGSGVDTNVAGLGVDLLSSVGSGSYTLTPADVTPPVLSNGAPTGTLVYTTTSATISATTNENATCKMSSTAGQAYTSGSMVAMSTTGGTSHSNAISGLTSGNTYTRYIRCSDTAGNQNTSDFIVTFSVAQVPDTTAPTISAVSSSAITTTGATVTWTTNEVSDTQVDYGLTNAYGASSALNSSLVTSHSVNLSGLTAGTIYHYRVKSKDAALNLATSIDQTFTTVALVDTTAPSVPTGLVGSSPSQTSALITWTASTDPVVVGQSTSGIAGYQVWRGGVQIASSTLTSFTNSGLTSGTLYSYQVAAYDNAGNISAKTTAVSVTTLAPVQRKIVLNLEGAPAGKSNVSTNIQYLNPGDLSLLAQAGVTTDTAGQVTVILPLGLPSLVTVRPIVAGYLSRLLTGADTTNATLLTFTVPLLPSGDFNSDSIVNSLDFSTMNANWLGSNATVDINKDGAVNSLDFAYLSNNWLQIGQ